MFEFTGLSFGIRCDTLSSHFLPTLYSTPHQPNTHIISSILHVGHDNDMESWPLIIEDFHGNTNEVHLEAGDILFYESSKCLHGRPRKMKGGWYSSVFSHYYPVGWNAYQVNMNQHYRVPPHWHEYTERQPGGVEYLQGVISSVMEPACEDYWCALKNTVQWYGPGPGYGRVMGADGVVTDLENIPSEESSSPDTITSEEHSTSDQTPNSVHTTDSNAICKEDNLVH